MQQEIELTPDPFLMESMRAVGYTAETAVADLIDNSLAAGSKIIDVLASGSGPSRLSIVDNGSGMGRDEALNAMRFAARSPHVARARNDLGRFGLGLKTASLSQCRRLTLVTRREGATTALRWDLDHVMATNKWAVLEVPEKEYTQLFGWAQLEGKNHGTLVAWESLDQFTMTEGPTQEDFDRAVIRVREHCELVFHRFVSGDGVKQVSLRFNGIPVRQLDPFLRKNRATQVTDETIRIDGKALKVHAFTLPYINKMTKEQKDAAISSGPLRDSQGFYIYRTGRLVIWGTWFRLNPKGEMGKLARVQVDIPNSLDHLWALDIKKSRAIPPRAITHALRNLAGRMIAPSERVQKFRGRKLNGEDRLTRMWNVVLERDKEFRHEINRHHPLLERFSSTLSPQQLLEMSRILDLIEATFPVVDAHNRLSEDGVSRQDHTALDTMLLRAKALRAAFAETHPDDDEFVQMIVGMEPFGSMPEFEAALKQELASSEASESNQGGPP